MTTNKAIRNLEITPDIIKFLIALQQEPLASFHQLARMLNVTPPTAKAKMDKISEVGLYYRVSADINCDAIDLQLVDMILEIDSKYHLVKTEDLLDKHPYILFRGRIVGPQKGIYVQFRIPKSTTNNLVKFLDRLKEKYIIDYFNINSTGSSIYTKADFKAWNGLTWNYDWNWWFSELDSVPIISSKKYKSVLRRLSELDLKVLEELSYNARIRNLDLATKLNVEPYQITRSIQFLKKNVISGFRVFLTWQVFNIFNPQIIVIRTSKKERDRLYSNLINNPIPFQSTMRKTKHGIIWYLGISQDQMSPFIGNLWNYFDDFDIYWLDYQSTETYCFWSETFDTEKKSWKTDMKFMVNSIFE